MILKIIFLALIAVFIIIAVQDLYRHRHELAGESGRVPFFVAVDFIVYFFTALGMSDTALAMIGLRIRQTVPMKQLPGTIVATALVPLIGLALSYMSMVNMDLKIILVLMVCSLLGSRFGAGIVGKCSAGTIRILIIGTLSASLILLIVKMFFLPEETSETAAITSLSMIILCAGIFLLMALGMVGLSCISAIMVLFMFLGIEPITAMAMAITLTALGCVAGSVRYIRSGDYHRKAFLCGVPAGFIGGVCGARFIQFVDAGIIRYFVLASIILALIKMISDKNK